LFNLRETFSRNVSKKWNQVLSLDSKFKLQYV
jgi:hypothetical protein